VLIVIGAGIGLISGGAATVVARWFIDAVSRRMLALLSVVLAVADAAAAVRLSGDRAWLLPAWWYFLAVGGALSLVDIARHRLPNLIVLPSYPVLAGLLTAAALGSGDWSGLGRAVFGAAVLFGGYFVIALIVPAGMGFGDVKLAGLAGALLASLSWSAVLTGTFVGYLLGAVAGLVVIVSRRGSRRSALPFGPFMIAGAYVALLVSVG
jgi:leader peptidase (prepilin peptidase)/N-methyltransferase